MTKEPDQNLHSFRIEGMHCASCELWLEEAIKKIPAVKTVTAKLNSNEVSVWSTDNVSEAELLKQIQEAISLRSDEYKVFALNATVTETHKETFEPVARNYFSSFMFAIIFTLLFLLLQKLDFINLSSSTISYPYIFLVGLVASISTCTATVGALVLSMSANFTKAKKSEKFAISTFHIGRLFGFFVLGGLLGLVGNFVSFSWEVEILLRIAIQVVLIVLGLNLLGVNFTEKFQPRLPKSLSRITFNLSEKSNIVVPFLLGITTFFLPCGFTQSIQLIALESKSFLEGSMIMLIFGLGTLPVLLLISKTSAIFGNSKFKDVFFKTAGFITIFMSIYGLYLSKNLFF